MGIPQTIMKFKNQKIINDFVRKYLDRKYRIDWNTYHFEETSNEHRKMVFDICSYLYDEKIPFLTRPLFKTGYKPDIICPTFHLPIIEVKATETQKKTLEKMNRIPAELQQKIIYVNAFQNFKPKLLL